MGIQNLLRLLANSTRDAHISEFENQFVAIDAYCWLHKGIYCCSVEIAMKKPTTKYVTYCMRYIEMLLHFKVKPIMVFDGRTLSSKEETEKKRRDERQRKYKKGIELIKAGQTNEGRKLLGESVDVTHELVLNLIKECRAMNIDCIVAPFEADAQLAYFSLRNIVKCIITEDSDLLAYGCERVMFKMDTSGLGKLVEKSKLYLSLGMEPDEFNEEKFRYMCILSGCDYLPSLNSIGPANALKFIKMINEKDIYEALPKLPLYLNKMKVTVTQEYKVRFRIADNTFKHQLVYDPYLRKQIPLRPVNNDDEIVGKKLPDDLAFQLAIGNVDPITMKVMDNFDPEKFGTGFDILWKSDQSPNTAPMKSIVKSFPIFNGSKKRQSEVFQFSNDLKKHRSPWGISNHNSTACVKSVDKVPETGFVFEPKVTEPKKKDSKLADESNLLNSRYFFKGAGKNNAKKDKVPTKEPKTDRRKDESYEDYLQRLYKESFPLDDDKSTEDEQENQKIFCCSKQKKETNSKTTIKLCSSCSKCHHCCECSTSNEKSSETQTNEDANEIESKYSEKKSSEHHFLLDEIYKSEKDVQKPQKIQTVSTTALTEINDVSEIKELDGAEKEPLHRKAFGLSQWMSHTSGASSISIDNSEKKLSVVEENKKDHDIMICEKKSDNSKRTPSPVFKIQKDNRVLNSNCRLGNVSDTAGTPTSLYFSPSASGRFSHSTSITKSQKSVISSRKTPSNSSTATLKSGKIISKSSSVHRTLFQFGFKKEVKEES